jgi:PAS domain S-box-containing protein
MAAEDNLKTKAQLIAELEKLREQVSQPDRGSFPQEIEEKYLQVVDHSLEGIYIVQDHLLKFCNQRFAEMYGFKYPQEALDIDVRGLISPRSKETVDREIKARISGEKQVSHYHFFARRTDGKEFEVETLGSRINYRGEPAVQGVMRDVSKQRELEEQLRRAQKMEAIGTLAGGIAHDFNNILSIIMGYADMSLSSLEKPEKLKHNLSHVLKAAHRAQDLVQQILSFSRQGEIQPVRVKVAPIVREALKLIRASLPSTIDIRQETGDENYRVFADPTQLHQVLMNLCSNAAHAMREKGGVLDVQISDLNRDLASIAEMNTAPSPYMRLTVKDTGHGMTAEVKERIFDPFFTTKGVGEGTGLGLSVVHGIVAGMDGEISVESAPGEGTAFHLFIPLLLDEEDTAPEKKSKPAIPRGSEHILLVDDESVLRDMGRKMLEQLGYTVNVQPGSLEALEAFRTAPQEFHLVVTDLTMPGLTGIELAVELHNTRPDVPVILCTGNTRELDREELTDLGIDDLLLKPFNKMKIANIVRRVLDGRKKD